ncbi:MAG: Gfo/Idh/MocA family oxidoreductase, partial [Planctomycetales bacterium]
MKPLRMGVIGTGHLGKFHARILSQTPGVELVGVADASAEAAEKVAAEHGVEAFSDWESLAARVDAAVLAVPTTLHHQLGAPLLENGIHLLIEKPLAATSKDALALADLAEQRGLVLAVGHVERFNPAWTALQGQLSDPKYVEANRLSGYTFRSTDVGVVLDLMIHDLDLLLSLVGRPVREVEALGVSLFGKHEDAANARITFD